METIDLYISILVLLGVVFLVQLLEHQNDEVLLGVEKAYKSSVSEDHQNDEVLLGVEEAYKSSVSEEHDSEKQK